MTQHEDRTPDGVQPPAEADGTQQTAGSFPQAGEGADGAAGTTGTADASADELTVDDILAAEQAEGVAAADGNENPYLDDLRRLTAEYANYRKRTEANAELEKTRAKASAVLSLIGVLDDLDRAEAHGDLEEGSAFATIAQKIRTGFERMGLEGFGEKGEVFDPSVHEAIAQVPVPGTEQSVVLDVIERGYRLGEVELRPAKVAVAVAADG